MIYGKHLSSDVVDKLHENGIKLNIEKKGDFMIYRREGGFPEECVEKLIHGFEKSNIMIYPIHSIQMEVSTHLLLRLSRPLIVAPRSKLAIYVKAPISVGIYVVEEEAQKLIDLFGFATYKYALYGTAASGVICRFHRTDVFLEAPQPELWEAVTKVSIENMSRGFVEIKNIVYPLLRANVYVDDFGRAYIEAAHLSISKSNRASVVLRGEPPLDGLRKCPQPFAKLLEKAGKFTMEFGL